jgi:hypothetical protein
VSKKFLIVVFGLMAVAFGYYGYLGGFNSPHLSITTSMPQYVAGQYYEGPADSREFGDFFKKAGQLQESKTLVGSLANIYYNNPEEKGDTIKAFIGILVPDSSVALPAGYEWRMWEGGRKVVQASIRANYLLAPDKLYPALFDYLKANNLKTSPQCLEQFLTKDSAKVEVMLIE